MRIATWNVNSLKARLPRVEEWLAYAKPDVLCMQETKLAQNTFPTMAFQALGYDAVHHGAGRWNGVAILSRVGLEDVVHGFSDAVEDDEIESRALWATCGGVRIASLYIPNGRSLDDPHYQYKLTWLERLARMIESDCDLNAPLALCGDFNVAPTDADVWNPARFVGATHVSEPERQAFNRLLDLGLKDTLRSLYPDESFFTFWDYRAGDFHMGRGMRIDFVLTTESLAKGLRYGLVDRNARKGKLPSDHAPLFIDVDV